MLNGVIDHTVSQRIKWIFRYLIALNINATTDTLYDDIIINLPDGIWSLVMYTLLDLMNDSYTYPLFCAAHICKTSNVMKEIRFGAIERN